MADRYLTSKLLLMLATRIVAEKYPTSPDGYSVIINYSNPGMCQSNIYRDDEGKLKAFAIKTAKAIFARSTEVGSRTMVHAVLVNGKDSHGQFVTNCTPTRSSTYFYSEKGKKVGQEFWDEMMAKLKVISPDV